jgi:histidine triad (HIT) family protein
LSADFYCDEVVSGRTPVEIVAETANAIAFKHTRPHYRGAHIVVIPRKHIASFTAVSPEDVPVITELLELVRSVAAYVERVHGGAHIVTNIGKYQESKHLHFHVGAD